MLIRWFEPHDFTTLALYFCLQAHPTALGGLLFFSTLLLSFSPYSHRGRERRFVRFPLPPNRTGGSPASGSPVDGLTPKGIDEQFYGRLTD